MPPSRNMRIRDDRPSVGSFILAAVVGGLGAGLRWHHMVDMGFVAPREALMFNRYTGRALKEHEK